jgi:magnesium chelatase family protein
VLAKVYSCATVGLDGLLVEVEVDVGAGPPGMFRVGTEPPMGALP